MPANQLFQFVVGKAISLSAVLRRGAVLAPRDFADLVGTPALGKVVTFRLAAVAALEVARFGLLTVTAVVLLTLWFAA